MSLLSVALHQVQLNPQYHPSYRDLSAGRPVTDLTIQRKKALHEISLRIGRANHATLLAAIRETDPKIHKDHVRKLIEELCEQGLMDKQVVYGGGKKVFYTARRAR